MQRCGVPMRRSIASGAQRPAEATYFATPGRPYAGLGAVAASISGSGSVTCDEHREALRVKACELGGDVALMTLRHTGKPA